MQPKIYDIGETYMFNYKNLVADEEYAKWCESLESIPFFFTYNDKEYHGFGNDDFTIKNMDVVTSAERESREYIFKFRDGIEVTLLLTHYFSHGATEWTVWFENTSSENSGIIEKVKTELEFNGKYPLLKGILGDHVNKYRPYSIELNHNSVSFSSDSGRATHINFPYFNLEYGDGGAMLAIGWAGTWTADFVGEADSCKYTASSVNGLRTYLKPHEKIRTALFLVAPYTVRDENYATNFWRSWFVEHNMPKANAEKEDIKPFSTCFLAYDTGLPNSDGSISERHTTWRPSMEKILAENIKADFRWFDAGWYIAPDQTSAQPFVQGHDWWSTVGTWELDKNKWPDKTFLESTEFAREHGMKTLVWFEPERVTDPENLAKYYGYNVDWAISLEGENAISNNIGDPDCRAWITGRICKMLRENKVEMYREDNNCNAAKLWKHLDSREEGVRNGITELKIIDAHYKMWDDIIACTLSYGGCGFVDSCASGGGRNDLESLRRAIPLLRSDSDRTSVALRLSMTTAFNKWIPFCGANSREKLQQLDETGVSDVYVWRASYLSVLNIDSQYVYNEDQNFDILRFGLNEWKRVNPFLLKDFYVLTPWHTENDNSDFTAYCFYDPQKEEGVLLAFRQEQCVREQLNICIPFADDESEYILSDEDTGECIYTNGKLTLTFAEPRSAKLIWIKKRG